MKSVLLPLAILIFLTGCFLNKKAQKSSQSNDKKMSLQNPFIAICECKNSKGLTIEDVLEKESKKKGISIEKYIETINPADTENALSKEVFLDEGFKKNLKMVMPTKDNPVDTNQANEEKLLNEAIQKHPDCMNVLPFFTLFAGN